jgi:hypothetical protein
MSSMRKWKVSWYFTFLYYIIYVLVFFFCILLYTTFQPSITGQGWWFHSIWYPIYNKLATFQFRFCSKILYFCWYHLHIFVLSVICLLCQLTIKGLPHSFCFVVMYYKSQNTSRTTEYKHVLSKEMRGIDISQQDTCWSKIHYRDIRPIWFD